MEYNRHQTLPDHVMAMIDDIEQCMTFGLAFSGSIIDKSTDTEKLGSIEKWDAADLSFRQYLYIVNRLLQSYLDMMNANPQMYKLDYDRRGLMDGYVARKGLSPIPKDNFTVVSNSFAISHIVLQHLNPHEMTRQWSYHQVKSHIDRNGLALLAPIYLKQEFWSKEKKDARHIGHQAALKYTNYVFGSVFMQKRSNEIVNDYGVIEQCYVDEFKSAAQSQSATDNVGATITKQKTARAYERLVNSIDGLRPSPFT